VGRKFTSGQKGMVAKKGVDYVSPFADHWLYTGWCPMQAISSFFPGHA